MPNSGSQIIYATRNEIFTEQGNAVRVFLLKQLGVE